MLGRFLSGAKVTPIEYVGARTISSTGSTSNITFNLTGLTGGIASSPSAGDLVLVFYGIAASTDISLGVITSEYTEVVELAAVDTYRANLSVNYKILSSAETSVTLSAPGTRTVAGAIQVWRGIDPTSPLDVTHTSATGGNGYLCNPPAILPSTPGAVVVAGGVGADGGSSSFSYTSDDLQAFRTIGVINRDNDVQRCSAGIGYLNWVSGFSNPNQFGSSTLGSLLSSWAAVTLALRPAE